MPGNFTHSSLLFSSGLAFARSTANQTLKNINKWNTKQEELKAPEPSAMGQAPAGISSANLTLVAKPSKPVQASVHGVSLLVVIRH